MFPRGPRFEPLKVSDVPGPNSYNPVSESQLDDYKRGAFLEKTDRFSKEKDSEVPGPGSYNIEPKKKTTHPSKIQIQPQNIVDRYAILQRKVEDLERVHNDGKKTYQNEIDRLKFELARSQKSNAEQLDRLEKQKKQNDVLDGRIQELKKAAAIDQAEIKDLRVKLRISEHDKTQMVAKHGEVGDLKKSLQSLESKRKEEVREKDRRIAELEKAIAMEKKQKEATETKLQDIKEKHNEELLTVRAGVQKYEARVAASQAETQQIQAALTSLEKEVERREETLLAQLEWHQDLMGQVAKEYGRLAASSISTTAYTLLKHQHIASQLHVLRLERKLTNSESQVVELANLVRCTKEQNISLTERLRDAEGEIAFCNNILYCTPPPYRESDTALVSSLDSIGADIIDSQQTTCNIDKRTSELSSEFYRLTCKELVFEYSAMNEQLHQEQLTSQQHAASLSSTLASHEAIAARLEILQTERTETERQLKAATDLVETLKSSSEASARQVLEMEKKMLEGATRNEITLKKERDTVRRLTGVVQKSRMAEDALRAEIEQLTTELTDAEKYQEAYYSLSDEVGTLIARNQLAEDEAQRLSKFNAEILGHNNPAQRIMYVDRIRRELAETKHKLVILTREQETTVAINEDLQHELEMYKSVTIPLDQKPRTNITRVGRPPLVNLTRSLNTAASGEGYATVEKTGSRPGRVLETIPGDMTLDEIL